MWDNLTAYMMNLQLPDLFAILYILVMVLVTLASNLLFISFVQSKPDGRKTVLGNK